MRRRLALSILFVCAASAAHAADMPWLIAQNIFDDEPGESVPEKPKSSATKTKVSDREAENKPVVKKKRKKGKKKKAKAAAASAPDTATKAEIPDYSPEELSRQSYSWAPDGRAVELVSEAPGIKPAQPTVTMRPATIAINSELPEPKVPTQGFKLPEIPLTQVLIVAGFVILFLIYRFRVGRQIKRKKY